MNIGLAALLALSLSTAPDLGPLGRGEALSPGLSWAEDREGTWTWEEALAKSGGFSANQKATLAFGYTRSVIWVRLNWTRPPEDSRDLYLGFVSTQVDRMDLRFLSGGVLASKTVLLGDNVPYDASLPRVWLPAVQLPLGSEGGVLIRVASTNSVTVDPRVYERSVMLSSLALAQAAMGFLLGFLFLMGLFNLFMLVTVRDTLYLWYTGYLVASGAYLLVYTGFLQALFPELKPFQNSWDVPLEGLLLLAGAGFAVRANQLASWRSTRWASAVFGALVVVSLGLQITGDHQLALRLMTLALGAMVALLEVGVLVQAFRGRRFSRFFAVGWSCLVLSTLYTMLGVADLIGPLKNTLWASAFLFLAIVAEIIVLSAALADRVRLLQKELDQHREKAMVADRLTTIGLLTAQVGHEINTPNHLIGLNAGLLDTVQRKAAEDLARSREDGGSGPDWQSMLVENQGLIKTIRQASDQIKQVVSGLRTRLVHQPAAGTCDLGQVLIQTAQLYELRWRGAGRLVVRAAGRPVLITGVEFRLQQLIVNLVTNALEADRHREGTVTLAVRSEDGSAFLEITDEGVGMPPEVLSRLGTPFFTTKSDQGGTGLGWGVCHEIVREHGGALEVVSQLGQGTTVTARFPLQQASSGSPPGGRTPSDRRDRPAPPPPTR